ncbi:hypothetical protein [Henriciella sp.]|uniref:hypothetical protein n=1 Tax=Henriciella sp. TaxID=1968823 RepID=UPI00260ECB3D|nr:hypothetical protein [Henriciella sp.]
MLSIIIRFAGVLALTIAFGLSVMHAQERPARMIPMQKTMANDCSPDNLTSVLNMSPDNLSSAYSKQLVTWCKSQQAAEKAAETKSISLSSSRAPAAPDPTQVAMDDDTLALWCGRNNCVCWKGKRYDGCHHTDIMCRPNTFKCVGKICGCTTVE